MKSVLILLIFPTLLFSQQELLSSCTELYKLNIAFDKKNVPEWLFFVFEPTKDFENMIIYPMQMAFDYDGYVQFKSIDGQVKTFDISYVDPGEEKKVDKNNFFRISSLSGISDSVKIGDLWGSGDLFTQGSLFKGRWKEIRFLTPFFENDDKIGIPVGYACSDWNNLPEVVDPSLCLKKRKKELDRQKKEKSVSTPEIYPNQEFWNIVEALVDCAEN